MKTLVATAEPDEHLRRMWLTLVAMVIHKPLTWISRER